MEADIRGTVATIVALIQSKSQEGAPLDAGTVIARETGLDSVAVMDLVMQLEDEFDISISLDMLVQVETIGDLAKAIHGLRQHV